MSPAYSSVYLRVNRNSQDGIGHGFFLVSMWARCRVLFQVLSKLLRCQGVRISEYRSVKVSGCTVEIWAWSLVSFDFC
jgi:hypothetical protein